MTIAFKQLTQSGLVASAVLFAALTGAPERARAQQVPFSVQLERKGLAESFAGITTHGEQITGLYDIMSTGVSTAPVREALAAWLATLSPAQREATMFPVDSPEWRKWANMHIYPRAGTSFQDMNDVQRAAALELLGAALSAKGLRLTRDIMRLNETVAEMTGKHAEYGEDLYWISVMGEPHPSEPWGFQVEGHHLALNYFVLGDQVVLSPMFLGSEPVVATGGKYAGTEILQDEQAHGLAFVNSLSAAQQESAILFEAKAGTNALAEAFKDNLVLDYQGLRGADMSAVQRTDLLSLIRRYVGNLREGHAAVRMAEVEKHLDDTYFAWIGATGPDSVFYYRIHSPVLLIEFDHQRPIAFERTGIPTRDHIHVVVRTPNGNDYGKDLLRQHYEAHGHGHGASHSH